MNILILDLIYKKLEEEGILLDHKVNGYQEINDNQQIISLK